MKKLINLFCLIGIIFFFYANSYSQQSDVLVRLSPAIGDNLDLTERNYYGMHPEFERFVNAIFYKRGDEYLITKIKYKNNFGENKDTMIVENKSSLGNLRANIRRINVDRTENMEDGRTITLTTKEGTSFTGKLLDIKLNKLFMVADLGRMNNSYLLNNYRVFKRDNIKSVFIKGKDSNKLKGFGIGFLFGAGAGALIGIASGDDSKTGTFGAPSFSAGAKALFSGIALGVVGGIIGSISSSGSTPDELIMINTEADYKKLTEYLSSYDN